MANYITKYICVMNSFVQKFRKIKRNIFLVSIGCGEDFSVPLKSRPHAMENKERIPIIKGRGGGDVSYTWCLYGFEKGTLVS